MLIIPGLHTGSLHVEMSNVCRGGVLCVCVRVVSMCVCGATPVSILSIKNK